MLSRERLKDTSLDYSSARTEAERGGEAHDPVQAYAERRGLVPESEIVLRERTAEVPRARSTSAAWPVRRAEAGRGHDRSDAFTVRFRRRRRQTGRTDWRSR